jgi:peroxiredoxin
MHNPSVPETLEGWSLLHLMYRVRWDRVRSLSGDDLRRIANEALALDGESEGTTVFVQMLGHKADLMLIVVRRDFDALGRAQLALARSELYDLLEPTGSYVSVVELGMYEMTAKIHEQLGARHTPGSDAFEQAFDVEMEAQRQRVLSRLFLEMPRWRYVCFYPMNKKRGEVQNWYSESFERRAAMMREHGMIGRHYSGKVIQVISDWEWGVDLFAQDPLVFKKLIYEMRFDEASARFAEFGPFYTGLQFAPAELEAFLSGRAPTL